jgi:hypothetical protein
MQSNAMAFMQRIPDMMMMTIGNNGIFNGLALTVI